MLPEPLGVDDEPPTEPQVVFPPVFRDEPWEASEGFEESEF